MSKNAKRATVKGSVGRAVYGQRVTRGGRVAWFAALPGEEPLLARDEKHAREIATRLDHQARQAPQAVDLDRVGRSALGDLWDRLPAGLRALWVWADKMYSALSPHETVGYSARAIAAIQDGRFPAEDLERAGISVGGRTVVERHHVGGDLVPFFDARDLLEDQA